MGSEGQNNPKNTSEVERKRPWEVFSEEEKKSIRKSSKQIDKNEKRKRKLLKCKAAFVDIKKFCIRHKIISTIYALIFSGIIVTAGFFCANLLIKMISDNSTEDAAVSEEEPQISNKSDIFNGITLKNAPNPSIAYAFATNKINPVLLEGVLDTGTINFSKIEDNYSVFEKTLESDYEKVCFYLAMIDSMFVFESDSVSARAAYLLERFDERKLKFDDTQYYFYLSAHIKYAIYKKDEPLIKKYRDEFNNKYSTVGNYFGLDDEEFVFNEEEF